VIRYTRYLMPTTKETPSDAEVLSHRLMLRAGLIRKVASGIYSYMPAGLRVLRKVERILREEMDRAGAQEVLLPAVVPSELWKESGRWEAYGKELLRVKDRADREFCLGPTHEEVITDLVRREVRSYRQLPLNLYQIQDKFRDEIRPRFGLMRGREFFMKDAYSFDVDDDAAAERRIELIVQHLRDVRGVFFVHHDVDEQLVRAPERAQRFEAAQVRAEQKAASPPGERGVEALLALHLDVEITEPASDEIHAVEDRRRKRKKMPPQVDQAGRPAQGAAEIFARAAARARRVRGVPGPGRPVDPGQAGCPAEIHGGTLH